uniref:Uncharacterized protein n=1 Tax=Acrobeloides nanus TaxID=290746 RepID=A0A914C200_9BILA
MLRPEESNYNAIRTIVFRPEERTLLLEFAKKWLEEISNGIHFKKPVREFEFRLQLNMHIMGIFNVHSTKDSCGPLMELLASKGLTYEESIVKDPFGQMALYMSRFF